MGENLIDTFIRDQHKDRVRAAIAHLLSTGENMNNIEFPFYTKDETQLTIRLNGAAKRDDTQRITGMEGVASDISEQRWREDGFYRFTEM